jgi:hypothetical protein
MRSFLVGATALVVLGSASPAAAYWSRYRGKTNLSMSALVEVGVTELHPGALRFTGNPTLGGREVPYAATGAQLGLDRVRALDASLHLAGLTHHVVIGGLFGVMSAGQRSLTGIYIGPELGTAWSFKWFDVRASLAIGYRELSVPLSGYDLVVCGRYGQYRCEPTANVATFFARPMASLGGHFHNVAFGGWLGGDVTSTGGWAAGAYLGVATDRFYERAQWNAR